MARQLLVGGSSSPTTSFDASAIASSGPGIINALWGSAKPVTNTRSWYETIVDTAYYLGSDYASYFSTQTATAGQTIVEKGRATGDFLRDHLSKAYYDPTEEVRRVKQGAVDTAAAVKQTAIYVYRNPTGVISNAGSATLNYFDRLTSDPEASGQFLGGYATLLAETAVGGAAKNVLSYGRSATAVAENTGAAATAAARAERAAMLRQVRADLTSPDPATVLEAQVARRYWRDLVAYDRKVPYPGGPIPGSPDPFGQIDIELTNAIIEATIGKGGRKVGQVGRLMNPVVNPSGKPVILFGPNVNKPNLIRALNMRGAVVAHGPGETVWQMLDNFIYGQ